MQLGQYYEANSLLHKINPMIKIIAVVPLFIFFLFVKNIWTPLCFIILILSITGFLGKVPLGGVLKYFLSIFLPIFIILFIFSPFMINKGLLINSQKIIFGPIIIYEATFIYSLSTALRIGAIISSILPFSTTTKPIDFIGSMVQNAKIPYRLGYTIMVAFNFVPMLHQDLELIDEAHRVRGISDKKGLRSQFDRMKRYALPLFATAIRRAERAAIAMDSRAFGAYKTRTFYKEIKVTNHDRYFLIVFWSSCILLVFVLNWAGILGPLTFLYNP